MPREDFIVKTWPYLIVFFLFIIISLTLGKYFGEGELFLRFNQLHHPAADVFFAFYTKTGEWIFGTLLFLWLVWKSSWRMVLIFITGTVLQLLTVQSLKRGLFIDHLRPAYYFQEKGVDLHLVEGVRQGITFTFPSGHTATAFFVFLFLCLLVKNRLIQFCFGFLAVLSAYSRIYLSQHFILDTVAGALIGVGITVFAYYLWFLADYRFLDKSPFRAQK